MLFCKETELCAPICHPERRPAVMPGGTLIAAFLLDCWRLSVNGVLPPMPGY